MMNEKSLKNIGYTTSQIGFYLMSMDSTLFQDTEINRNIVTFISQVALLLNDILENKTTSQVKQLQKEENIKFLSRKDVIQKYHPLITEYALNQAIQKKQISYTKRGTKYYFDNSDIENWINNQRNNSIEQIKSVNYV